MQPVQIRPHAGQVAIDRHRAYASLKHFAYSRPNRIVDPSTGRKHRLEVRSERPPHIPIPGDRVRANILEILSIIHIVSERW